MRIFILKTNGFCRSPRSSQSFVFRYRNENEAILQWKMKILRLKTDEFWGDQVVAGQMATAEAESHYGEMAINSAAQVRTMYIQIRRF